VRTAEVSLTDEATGRRWHRQGGYQSLRQHCCPSKNGLVAFAEKWGERLSRGVVLVPATALHFFLQVLVLAGLLATLVRRSRDRGGDGQAGEGRASQQQE